MFKKKKQGVYTICTVYAVYFYKMINTSSAFKFLMFYVQKNK